MAQYESFAQSIRIYGRMNRSTFRKPLAARLALVDARSSQDFGAA